MAKENESTFPSGINPQSAAFSRWVREQSGSVTVIAHAWRWIAVRVSPLISPARNVRNPSTRVLCVHVELTEGGQPFQGIIEYTGAKKRHAHPLHPTTPHESSE